ncbi:neuroendocrine convertase 1-like [Colias croceus]|uniref:neuroendocrine convertase 1-like n=1 Tax=Colias crocea TaxID=72248 RepID=UPI001E281650|nr:neuroendocrine convertase 1-like [Colias croceus]
MTQKVTILLISTTASHDGIPGYYDYHKVHNGLESSKDYIDEWTVEVPAGEEVAQLVALELGYEYDGPLLGFPNVYAYRVHSKNRRTPSEHTSILANDRRIRWSEQLFTKKRAKRYPLEDLNKELLRVKRKKNTITNASDEDRNKRNVPSKMFNDELWGYEWYLQDTRTFTDLPRLDLNVLPVYDMGFNGLGVRISILDDGIEHNHTDLRDNYDKEISWDCNDRDSDPFPRYDEQNRNSHGTRCAGEIAMVANNGKCGVGVAWRAKVGGVRMLDGRITDRVEGEAIGYAWDKVDIYSASWGPNDDGKTVEGPGRLAIEAFKRGIEQGRGGKGNIFVWANGNGGGHGDNCNCDGYSSSIYTISIGSASQQGLFPWYGEICSSTLATAYSSGAYKDQKIATTDTNNSCTLGHTGTSAAAPLAVGIIALALHANPNLTWRDVQHLIVWTSEYAPLSQNKGWQVNGAGLRFDVRFGFGLLNAARLVSAALNWITVPPKQISTYTSANISLSIRPVRPVEVDIYVNGGIQYLEHVELIISIQYTRRGALEIYLVSPQGTKVQVLSPRPKDSSEAGFFKWPLTSVATWGENPNGIWKVIVQDLTREPNYGIVEPMTLIIHGTEKIPNHMKNGPRIYKNDDFLDNEINNNLYLHNNDNNDFFDFSENIFTIPGNQESVDYETSFEGDEELFRINHHSKNHILDGLGYI